jgi:hypothetical protein
VTLDSLDLLLGLFLYGLLRWGFEEYLLWKAGQVERPTKKNSLVLWRWDEIKRKRK